MLDLSNFGMPLPCLTTQLGEERLKKYEAAADAESDGFGAAGGSEFAEDGGYVKFGSVVGNVEPGRDFFVSQTGGEHLQNFALTTG